MPDVRAGLFELHAERTDFSNKLLLCSEQAVQMGAFRFYLLTAKVEDAMEAKFKSFHGWSLADLRVR